jgi:hypothetical protein
MITVPISISSPYQGQDGEASGLGRSPKVSSDMTRLTVATGAEPSPCICVCVMTNAIPENGLSAAGGYLVRPVIIWLLLFRLRDRILSYCEVSLNI